MNYFLKSLITHLINLKPYGKDLIPTELSTENYNKESIDSAPYTLFYAPYVEQQLQRIQSYPL